MKTLKFTQLILALALTFCIFDVNAQNPYLSESEWDVFIGSPEEVEQSKAFTVANGQVVGFIYDWGYGQEPLDGYAPSDLLFVELTPTGDSFLVHLQPLIIEACIAHLINHILFRLIVIVNPVVGLLVELAIDIAISYAMNYWSNAKIPVINNLGLLAGSLSIKKERFLTRRTNNGLLAFDLA